MNRETPILYLVLPCYNEQEVLHETAKRLMEKMNALLTRNAVAPESRILFVNDGSRDSTWDIIASLCKEHPLICGLCLTRNKGHQNALLAGLEHAKERCDCAISLDADLQDDIDAIDGFLLKFAEGCDVVYGVRSSRATDTAFKRSTAVGFYKFMKALGVDIVENHADYRLMSARALEGLSQFEEVNLFLRGIVPLIGYESGVVTYERHERFAGESKYPLKKMLGFAFDGITSFSVKPIRLVTGLGFLIFFCSIVALIYCLVVWILGRTVAGWTTMVASLWLLGGIQLLSLGVIGEYVGKIYGEVKKRPRYLVKDIIDQ